MKRNGIVNLVRVWLKEIFSGNQQYIEIIPRNYFHALQMNEFSILSFEKHTKESKKQSCGVIVLPHNENIDLLDDHTMKSIIYDWFIAGCQYKSTYELQVNKCIRGVYHADSGEVFNKHSFSVIVDVDTLEELADLAVILKDKLSIGMIMIQMNDSHRMFRV
jgi:hypothetical protein